MSDSKNSQDPEDRVNNPLNNSKDAEEHPKKDAFDFSGDKSPAVDSTSGGDNPLDRAIGSARRRPVSYQRTQSHLPGEFQSGKDQQEEEVKKLPRKNGHRWMTLRRLLWDQLPSLLHPLWMNAECPCRGG